MDDSGPGNRMPKGLRWLNDDRRASLGMGLLIVWVLFLLFVVIPWILTSRG